MRDVRGETRAGVSPRAPPLPFPFAEPPRVALFPRVDAAVAYYRLSTRRSRRSDPARIAAAPAPLHSRSVHTRDVGVRVFARAARTSVSPRARYIKSIAAANITPVESRFLAFLDDFR